MTEGVAEGVTGGAYRPELDGLRTFAVVVVMLFHAEIGVVSGGFLGVDVFFVLSGFLITGLMLDEVRRRGRVDLTGFYARRGRRLLPAALLAILGICIVWLLTASVIERDPVIGDARASALYFANWHFAAQATDYFAQANSPSPFLHFWSLAAEEQFYLLWPALLMATVTLRRRFARHASVQSPSPERDTRGVMVVAAALAAASLASVYLPWSGGRMPWSYFGTHARLYQLLGGAVLAAAVTDGRLRTSARVAHTLQVVGAVTLVALATSWWDLHPVTRGTATAAATLVLLVGLQHSRPGPVTRALSVRAAVWVGQRSYAVYLWHWPVVLILRKYWDLGPWLDAACCAVVTLALAWLSGALLEFPVRGSNRLRARPVASLAGGLALSLVLGAAVAPALLGVERRPVFASVPDRPAPVVTPAATTAVPTTLDPGVTSGTSTVDTSAPAPSTSSTSTSTTTPPPEALPTIDQLKAARKNGPVDNWHCDGPERLCLVRQGGPFTMVVIGDSHLLAWLDTFMSIAERHDVTLYVSLVLLCPWHPTVVPDSDQAAPCQRHHDALYGTALPALHPDLVVTVTRAYDDPAYPRPVYDVSAPDQKDPSTVLTGAMASSVATVLQGADRLLVVRPWPTFPFNPRDCLSTATAVEQCTTTAVRPLPSDLELERIAAREPRVGVIDLIPSICPTMPVCAPMVGGVVARFDNDHLTYQFALTLEDELDAALQAAEAFTPAG